MAIVYYAIRGGGGTVESDIATEYLENSSPLNLVMLIPVAVVIIVAFKVRDVYIAASIGILVGIVVGLLFGLFGFSDIFSVVDGTSTGMLVDGFNGMLSVVILIIIMLGVINVLTESGVFESIVQSLSHSSLCKTARGTELTLAVLMTVISSLMGCGQDPALVLLGPVYNDVGQNANLHPYRRAEIIDAMSTMLPACIPVTSIYLFLTASMTTGYDFVDALTPVQLVPGCAYCLILFALFIVSILTGWGRLYEGPNGEPLKSDGSKLKNLLTPFYR